MKRTMPLKAPFMQLSLHQVVAIIFCSMTISAHVSAQTDDLVLYWDFDRVADRKVSESVSGTQDALNSVPRLTQGVKGQAIVMDGYTTCVVRKADQVPILDRAFTIEAWIALGAYPWNWAPIASQENTVSTNSNRDAISWPDDIGENSPRAGFFFGVDPQGHLGLHVGADGWQVCRTERQIPLRTWTHVAASYVQGKGIVLYINGETSGEMEVKGDFSRARTEDLRIGMARQQIEPSHPVRAFATLPCLYSLDGLVDELKIHKQALSGQVILEHCTASQPASAPDLPPRVMPSGPSGPGKFGASYMNLKYYPEWDALWRVSSDPDVVVQFDNSPIRVVFWRGTRYSPAWVMENGLWMADQSIENFNNRDGCIEHMLDYYCRFSHVRIVENTPARVVVHWRYCPTSANGNHSQVNAVSTWEDWVDEYYTFYPDQVGVRKVILHTDGEALWPEEVIGLCQPGQKPEDVVDLSALTLVNLRGETHTYTWTERSPVIRKKGRWERGGYIDFGDAPGESPNIMMVNFKSGYKPFQIFELDCNFSVFAHEHRKEVSHFPWWNHWPAALIPSDGRYCQAADRPSHFSLAWATPNPHQGENETYYWAWMYGATQDDPRTLAPLAKSWVRPPELSLASGGTSSRYDSTQRCYVISHAKGAEQGKVEATLKADSEHPVFNPALVIEDWGDRPAHLMVNNERMTPGSDFRTGYVRRVNDYDLVLWLRMKSDRPVTITLSTAP